MNGRLTQGENIADNGGIKTAFGAYQTWLDEHGGQEKQAILPALNMTEVQAFFLGFGQVGTISSDVLRENVIMNSLKYREYCHFT